MAGVDAAKMSAAILPGQGKCLGGDEGRKVLHKFREFAATFPLPLTADAKKQLRARYIQMHINAGGFVCVCPVFFVAPVTFFCAGMTRTEKQAKEAVDNLSKKKMQAVSAHARFGLFCCFDQCFFAGLCKAQARQTYRARAPSRS